jgi:hypothetical protein
MVAAATTTRAQDRLAQIAAKLRQELSDRFRVNALQVDGKSLQVVVNDREISDETYQALVTTTCAHLGADARQYTEIAFANRFAVQGYVFAAPAKCGEVLKLPPERQKAAILADTHEL